MELVYLWVEDYKNIHKQGFNFSPRFECEFKDEYDEDGKLKDNCELIINPKEHLEDFFGKNINVTAIVGENGSGKSSVLKLILFLIFCKNYKKDSAYIIGQLVSTLKQFANKELFLIIYIDDSFKKIAFSSFIRYLKTIEFDDDITTKMMSGSSPNKNEILSNIEELEQEELNFFSTHFNYMLDTLYDGIEDNWIKSIYHKADSYVTPLLLEPYKNNNDRQLIDIDTIEYLNNQNMLRFYSKFDNSKKLIDFFQPNKIALNFSIRNFDWLNLNSEDFKCLENCKYFIAYKFFILYENNDIFLTLRETSKVEICKICIKIDAYYKKRKFKELNYLYIALKVLSSEKKLFDEHEYEKINIWATQLKSAEGLFSFIEDIDLTILLSNEAPNYAVHKISTCINFTIDKIFEKKNFIDSIEKTVLLNEVKFILDSIPPWINAEWFEENKSIKSLSSGEKTFFTFIINVMYQIQNINDIKEYETINIFLDETELGLHPNWQKQYILKIIEVIKQVNNKKINLFFATHSPFILSDLPKENVIFLKDGEQQNIDINPFGANIHTLLSHGFFMQDGLMGEFAKNKINEIIDFLNNEKKIEDISTPLSQIKKVIDSIGEPFLQAKLEQMYQGKLGLDDELERLEKQQKAIDLKIEELKKQKSEDAKS